MPADALWMNAPFVRPGSVSHSDALIGLRKLRPEPAAAPVEKPSRTPYDASSFRPDAANKRPIFV